MTHIDNDFFAWFRGTESKSRINFLELLRADHSDYRINDQALAYMEQQKLPKAPLQHLRNYCGQIYANEAQWEAHLQCLGITRARHRRIATEGALLGSILDHGFSQGCCPLYNVMGYGL